MGKDGWNAEQARKVIDRYGADDYGDGPLKQTLKEGASGNMKWGPPADVSPAEAEELRGVRDDKREPSVGAALTSSGRRSGKFLDDWGPREGDGIGGEARKVMQALKAGPLSAQKVAEKTGATEKRVLHHIHLWTERGAPIEETEDGKYRLTEVQPGDPVDTKGQEERLIERLRLAPDRQWAESFLDLAGKLVEAAELGGDDPRLVMSIPKAKCLPITLNSRYVLSAFEGDERDEGDPRHAVIGLILPATMKEHINELPGVIGHGPFDSAYAGEAADNVPRYVRFSIDSKFNLGPQVLEGWRQALLAERDHGSRSRFRRFHEPVVYRAVTDLQYRRELLDRAFTRG
jgi:biotin operon repressor